MDTSELVARLRAAGCVFAEDEARLLREAAHGPDELATMLGRRVAGEPLEHVIGWAEFAGLRVAVGPGVFRPRPRTEHLVVEAITLGRARHSTPLLVVDLCCGSGAIGLAVTTALSGSEGTIVRSESLQGVELHAADIDAAAVACARRNVARLGGQVHEGDLYEALPGSLRGRVDLLLANVPYVPTDQLSLMPAEARDHEPVSALDGGVDGLDLLRRVAQGAASWLAPGGSLLSEVSEAQLPAALTLIDAAGLRPTVSRSAELEATVVIGRGGR